jgi:hypothetical protein
MRSNFREIPQYLELMQQHGMIDVALQTMELSPENTSRIPALEADEAITARQEVEDLHAILRDVLPRFRKTFRMVRVSGLHTLFEKHGLSAAFLEEGGKSLYPDSDGLSEGAFELCPNPWTTLFLVENGDVHLCFISQPIGNLYSDSLSALWNSPMAISKRSDMISGRYLASGCSRQYCGWREGQSSPPRDIDAKRREWRELASVQPWQQSQIEASENLALVRRLVVEERRKRNELEVHKRSLESLLEGARRHIDHLEGAAAGAVTGSRSGDGGSGTHGARWLVRAARKAGRVLGKLSRG